MHDTGCLGLVHLDNPEGWYGEGGGRGVQDGEHMYTCVATPSSVLVWRIPWTEEPGPYSPWGRKESDTTEQLTYTYEKTVILVEGQK